MRGDGVAREGTQRQIVAGDGDRGVDDRIWRAVDDIVFVSCVKRRIIRGLIRVVW